MRDVGPLIAEDVGDWCALWLGGRPEQELFVAARLSRVIGLRLEDGREVVVKVRTTGERVRGCVEVQRHLWAAGYPCPEPLAGPAPLGEWTATAEAYLPGGALLTRSGDAPRMFGEALADLIRRVPAVEDVPSLDPPPPWVWWAHDEPDLWPQGDGRLANLNAPLGLEWIDEAGQRARARLRHFQAPAVVGHSDWDSQNLRWTGGRLHAVHDWDSAVALPEVAIVGAASAVFTADGTPTAATLDESSAFIAAYERSRGVVWSDDEREACWAAGLCVRAFNARIASVHAPDGPVIWQLHGEVEARLRRAGA